MKMKRLLGCGLLLLSPCQRPDEAVVGIKGRSYTRTPAELAQSQLTPTLHDADVAKKDRLLHGSSRRTFLVYESYEALALFRIVPAYLDRFRALDIVLVRYNFSIGLEAPSPFRQHQMQRLVAGLRRQR